MKIDRREFINALIDVSPGLPEKEMLAQTAAFMFRNKKVYTFNEKISINRPVLVNENFTIKSDEILSLLENTSDKTLELKVNILKNKLILSGKRKNVRIALSSFSMPIVENKKEWRLLSDNFMTGLQMATRILSCRALSEGFWTSCVRIYDNKIEACDNYRAFQYLLDEKIDGDIIISVSSLKNIERYSFEKYSIDKKWIHFLDREKTQYSCRIVNTNFQDLSSFFTKEEGDQITFSKNTKKALNRAILFSGDPENSTVDIEISKGSMLISARKNTGWYKESVKCSYKKTPIKFIINGRHFMEILEDYLYAYFNKSKEIMYFKGNKFIYCCRIANV